MSQFTGAEILGSLDGRSGVLNVDAVRSAKKTGLPSPPLEPQSGKNADTPDAGDEDLIEDYDNLELDPDVHVGNTRPTVDESYRPARASLQLDSAPDSGSSTPALNGSSNKQGTTATGIELPAAASTNDAQARKRGPGLKVRLEETGKKGRYILTADDPETKEILRRGIEREAEAAGTRKKRMRIRDLVFTRQFTTFDRQNPALAQSPFFGFFTLFWICMAFMVFNSGLKNYRDYGSILGPNEVMKLMMSRDLYVLGLTDGVMYLATFEAWFLQKLVQKGWIRWSRSGWVLQNLWQMAYLGAFVGWTFVRDWPWTHTIFIVLHGLVFLMKQHSYAFYNGYLSGVARRKALLEKKLAQLEAMQPIASPPTSPLSSTTGRLSEFPLPDEAPDGPPLQRRASAAQRASTNLQSEQSEVAAVAAAIESNRPLDATQFSVFRRIITAEIEDLATELQGKAEKPEDAYPHNLTLANHGEWVCLPTLVYELGYPRQEHINWWYVLEKTCATFGILVIMQVISQAYIYPLVMRTVAMKAAGYSLEQRSAEFPYILADMLFPMLLEQLLTWYLIWECILNVLAEVTRFADRGFYGDWWNSVTWDQYARDWNRPVHNFLLRHVYFSSISTFHLSRHAATFVTFFLSALVHEMCMALMFRKLRGYLFWMQLMQMPLVAISRTKWLRGKVILGNTMFWIGLFMGPSVLTCLYLII